MMTYSKACFSKHSQWPPKSFRLRQARELMLLLSFLGCLRVKFVLPFIFFFLSGFQFIYLRTDKQMSITSLFKLY
ncbi:hypothetical protein VIGAN_01026800 [Vigna angularis var. angularis]|uniref:Uncharacterized protein n=1 Tax=Vigna angularis var. angularis TaxID=157739 RepID=A0A0S3QWU6_PHAAN|nr:hypothetical protein VIGAN_01026800 [Vigna angularis var. angularis]